MSKPPSDATAIRTLKAHLKEERARADRLATERELYRQRATKAEQEAAEWKARFDVLLRREPTPNGK